MKNFNSAEDLKILITDELERIGLGKVPEDSLMGLCSNIEDLMPEGGGYQLIAELSLTWEYYTGNSDYPVPVSLGNMCTEEAKEAYNRAFIRNQQYGNTEYGDLRRDLARHCAVKLKEWSVEKFYEVCSNGLNQAREGT